MAPPDLVIDLGEDWARGDWVDGPSGADPARAGCGAGPARGWHGGGPARGWRGPWPVLAALAALVLLLAGAAPADPARLAALFTLPVAQAGFLLLPDAVVVYQGHEVDGYGLRGGTARWRAQVPQRVGRVAAAPQSRVLIVATGATDPDARISVLDLDTGAALWTDGGGLLDLTPSGSLLLQRMVNPDGSSGVRARAARTGAVAWAYTPPPSPARDVTVMLSRTGPGRVLLRDSLGTAQVVAEDTGQVLATGALDPVPALSTVDIVGAGLYQAGLIDGLATVIGYDLDTLTPRWRTSVDLPEGPSGPLLLDCGAVLCLSSRPEMAGLDPVTGAVLWRSGSWFYGVGLGGGRLLASFGIGIGPSAIMDARTLRPLREMGGWRLVRPPGGPAAGSGSELVVLGSGTASRLGRLPRTGGTLGPGTGGPVTWVAVLDADRAVLGPLGRLGDSALADCQGGGGYLACRVAGGGVRVWQYRT